MLRYYCDCEKGKYKIRFAQGFTQLQRVDVDEDECCIYCGYYAFVKPDEKHELFPRSKYLRDTEPLTTKTSWSHMMDKYYQYFHGEDQPKWGQKKIERELYEKQRVGGAKK